MAIRQVQRRLLTLFATTHPQSSSLRNEALWNFLPSAKFFLGIDDLGRRRMQTLSDESSEQSVKDAEGHETSSLRPDSESSKPLSNPANNGKWDSNTPKHLSDEVNNDNYAVKFNATSKLKVSSRHDLAMVFTCKVCETRSMKTMCRESYEKGVVVARCGGCNNLHLIADHLGMFGLPGSIEDVLAARGESVKRGSVDTLNITLEDLAGKEFAKKDW